MRNPKRALFALVLTACSAEVHVVDDTDSNVGGSTTPPVDNPVSTTVTTTSSSGAGGMAGDGGGPSGGGPSQGGSGAGGSGAHGNAPLPVAGCEVLLEDEPFVIPDARIGFVAAIDSSQMGFVGTYVGADLYNQTRSRRLSFGAWPPVLTDEVLHSPTDGVGVGLHDVPLVLREDGTFGIYVGGTTQEYLIGSFYEPGLLPMPGYAAPILEPALGGGYYLPSGENVYYYPNVDSTDSLATLPLGGELSAFGNSGSGDTILLVGDELLRLKNGELEMIGVAPPLVGTKAFGIVPRPGGFWFGALSQVSASPPEMTPVEIAAVDDDGAMSPPHRPFGDATNIGLARMTTWQGGVALVAQRGLPGSGFLLAVTDGHGTTIATREDPQEHNVCTCAPSIVVSPDGASVYVGHFSCIKDVYVYMLRRFYCGPQ